MFSHVCIGTNDFPRARAFYEPLMALLGLPLRFVEAERGWMGWQSEPGPRPLLILGRPFDGQPHTAGNGQMVALLAASRPQVDAFHALALRLGAQDEGAPGLRPHYHPHYYGAYMRDLDGNKLCIACHEAA